MPLLYLQGYTLETWIWSKNVEDNVGFLAWNSNNVEDNVGFLAWNSNNVEDNVGFLAWNSNNVKIMSVF